MSGTRCSSLIRTVGSKTDLIARTPTGIRTGSKAGEGDDPWLLSESTIDITFAITQTGTISLGVDGELANELTHTIRLGLAPNPT